VTDALPPAAKPLKIPRSVLVVIIAPNRQTLLIERADAAGFWQSVTGSQEEGETFAATAERELFEETGFVASEHGGILDLQYENVFCIYPRWQHRYPPKTTHNHERCFAICLPEPLTPKLAAREHVSYEWLPVDAAIKRVTSWSNAAAFGALALQTLHP
jgi:dihydroneopterin triphosphate diphosphatase